MNFSLNLRHQTGLFMTALAVSLALLADASLNQTVGIGLLGLALTWLIGKIRLSTGVQKPLATALIVVFGLAMLGLQRVAYSKDSAEFAGQVSAALLIVVCFIGAIRWRVHLNGYINAGKQALSIFAIVFCSWGLLLVLALFFVSLSSGGHWIIYSVGVAMAALYMLGLWASIRWLRRLRREGLRAELA